MARHGTFGGVHRPVTALAMLAAVLLGIGAI